MNRHRFKPYFNCDLNFKLLIFYYSYFLLRLEKKATKAKSYLAFLRSWLVVVILSFFKHGSDLSYVKKKQFYFNLK